jgi:hypothetical protein
MVNPEDSESKDSESEGEPRYLLPPLTAVQMVWALTGLFSKERPVQNSYPFSKEENPSNSPQQDEKKNGKNPDNTENAANTEEKKEKKEDEKEKTSKKGHLQFPTPFVGKALEDIRKRAGDDYKKNLYVDRVLAAMDASLRSLNTIYKGRNLNFDENTALRAAYLKSMEENIKYGFELKDLLKTLPTTTLISTSGGITLAEILAKGNSNGSVIANLYWPIIIIFAGLGFFVGLVISWHKGKETQKLHIRQDLERKLYFCSYLQRVYDVLESLYNSVCSIYYDTFGKEYPRKKKEKETITKMLAVMMPKICEYAPRHLIENKINPELWPICETGNMEIIRNCKVWKKENRESKLYRKFGGLELRIGGFSYEKIEEPCKNEWVWPPLIPKKTSKSEAKNDSNPIKNHAKKQPK